MFGFLHTLRFEAVPDAAPLGPAGEPDTGTGGDPLQTLVDETFGEQQQPEAPPQGGEPDLAATVQEQQRIIDGMYGYLEQLDARFNAPPQVEPQAPEAPQWDPLDPNAVGQYLTHTFGQMLDERLGAMQPLLDSFGEQQGEQVANRHFDSIAATIGEFDREVALDRALYLTEVAGIPGAQALEYAARETQARDAEIARAAVAAYETRMQNGPLSVDGEAAATGNGAERIEPLPRGKEAYREQARRSLEARTHLRAVS